MAIRNSKVEAEFLIDFAKEEHIQQNVILTTLKILLTPNNINFESKQWNQEIAKFIQNSMLYITVKQNVSVDFNRIGGIPGLVKVEGPIVGVTIHDRENLINLMVEVDNSLNRTEEKIHHFLEKKNPKWSCQCGRYLDAELSSFDEVKKFLRNFLVGKYRKCRSCKRLNRFEILNGDNIIFSDVDTYSK